MRTRMILVFLLFVSCLQAFSPLEVHLSPEKEWIRVGVLAHRGKDHCLLQWGPTANYLSSYFPKKFFSIVPLDFEEVESAVSRGEVEFILTNSADYVNLEFRYSINRIATLKNFQLGGSYTQFGGVVFCRAQDATIKSADDIKDKRVMGVSPNSLGGWLTALREFKKRGIDINQEARSIQYGGTQDAVVQSVLQGDADVGVVRTDIIEQMAADGSLTLQDIRVIPLVSDPDYFPLLISTRLYPEWPWAKVNHTSNTLAEDVLTALLKMPADSPAAVAAGITGWSIPYNYQPVQDLLKDLKLPPYENLGKITLRDVLIKYWPWILPLTVFFLLVIVGTVIILHLNKDLHRSHQELQQEMKERAETAKALTRLASVVEQAGETIIITDLEGRIVYANPAFEQVTGFDRDAILGQNPKILKSGKHDNAFYQTLWDTIKSGSIWRGTFINKKLDGQLYCEDANIFPIKDDQGEIINYAAVKRNISEKIEAENALKESEEKFRSITSSARDAIIMMDHHGDITYWNPAAEEIFGYAARNIMGKNLHAIIAPPEIMERHQKGFAQFIKTGTGAAVGRTLELEGIRKNEERFPLALSLSSVRIKGKWHAIGIVRDITERRQYEQQLLNQYKFLQILIDTIPYPIFYKDVEGVYQGCNKAFETAMGKSRDEIIGKTAFDMAPADLAREYQNYDKTLLEQQGAQQYEGSALYADGVSHDILYSKSSFFDVDGQLGGLVGVMVDITQKNKAEKTLNEQKAFLDSIVNNIHDGICLMSPEGAISYCNPAFARIMEGEIAELKGLDIAAQIEKETFEKLRIESKSQSKEVKEFEFPINTLKGQVKYIHLVITRTYDEEGNLLSSLCAVQDITQGKLDEIALQESEQKYRTIFENIQDVYYERALDGTLLEISPSVKNISHFSRDELIGTNVHTMHKEKDQLDQLKQILIQEGHVFDFEIILQDKNGDHVFCSINSQLIRDKSGEAVKIVGSLRDISQRKKNEEHIGRLLKEKEVLLKEVHHRVKNNFMVISSLLNLQSRQIRDAEAREIFRESQNRVSTMALIHQKLYSSDNLASIDFGGYLRSLVLQLYRSYAPDPGRVQLKMELEPIPLGVTQGIPCGLIVNELVTNALKYGFPESWSGQGEIAVIFREAESNELELIVTDNGVGLPPSLDVENLNSLGIKLVYVLGEEQLGGSVTLNRDSGTAFNVRFSMDA